VSTLNVRLFGRFLIDCDGLAVDAVHGFKAQELLSYLVLFRNRPQPRETLAAMLWKDASTAQSRKYLRQTLWQLHAALKFAFRPVVVVEPEWVHLDPQADVWVDVSAFERAFLRVKEIPGECLDAAGKEIVQSALDLYQGNLLEGWFQDWCLSERDRLQNMYLHLLDKLLGYCELHREYDTGVFYGELGLRHDRAHERTHQRLMRLQYLSGDRTAALRQYRHCVEALRTELDAPPSKSTIVLHQQIQADELITLMPTTARGRVVAPPESGRVAEALAHLKDLEETLLGFQTHVRDEIRSVYSVLQSSPPSNSQPLAATDISLRKKTIE
jgi:DNA-binding SARP family transcriptional activator